MSTHLSDKEVRSSFPGFREEGLRRLLADQGRVHQFSRGTVIMDYGDPIRMIPLVLEGSIKISRQSDDDAELFLYYLTAGDSCAMTFDGQANGGGSEIRAVAAEDARILGLPVQCFSSCMRFPSWQQFVLGAYSRRGGYVPRHRR